MLDFFILLDLNCQASKLLGCPDSGSAKHPSNDDTTIGQNFGTGGYHVGTILQARSPPSIPVMHT